MPTMTDMTDMTEENTTFPIGNYLPPT
jgi:hypothetical protein